MELAALKTNQVAFNSSANGVARPAAAQVTAAPAAAPTANDAVTISSGSNASNSASAANSTGAPAAGTPPQPKEWTILTYFCSDNNLYPYELQNLKDMEQVGGSKDMNLIAEFSKAPKGGGVERYEVGKGSAKTVADLGKNLNMSDPKSLTDAIKWAKANYPAKHYAVIMNDHGNAWQGCCQTESKDGWFTLPKLEQALNDAQTQTDGKPVDVLGFDCCLMANVENLDQVGKNAKYLVGSEETEGGPGWAYNQVMSPDTLRALQTTQRSGELTPEAFAKRIVTSAHGHDGDLPTMTAFDTSKIPALMDSIKTFGQAIKDTTAVSNTDLAGAADSAQAFTIESDLSDFASKVADKSGDKDAKLTSAAQAVQKAVADSEIAEEHSDKFPGAHGVTVELTRQDPTKVAASINPDLATAKVEFGKYQDLRFAKEVGFNQAVDKFRTGAYIEQLQI